MRIETEASCSDKQLGPIARNQSRRRVVTRVYVTRNFSAQDPYELAKVVLDIFFGVSVIPAKNVYALQDASESSESEMQVR